MTIDRFTWAAEVVNPSSHLHILEIGCGAGQLAEKLCGAMKRGSVTAIDMSKSMISKARKRNQPFIDNKVLTLHLAAWREFSAPSAHFDKVVAFNLDLFVDGTAEELAKVRDTLKAGGQLCVFQQFRREATSSDFTPIRTTLTSAGFEVTKTLIERRVSPSALCVIAS